MRQARGEVRALATWEGGPEVGRTLGLPRASALLRPVSRVHSLSLSPQSAGRAGRNGERASGLQLLRTAAASVSASPIDGDTQVQTDSVPLLDFRTS